MVNKMQILPQRNTKAPIVQQGADPDRNLSPKLAFSLVDRMKKRAKDSEKKLEE
jgi:hypothetical protein